MIAFEINDSPDTNADVGAVIIEASAKVVEAAMVAGWVGSYIVMLRVGNALGTPAASD